MIAYTSQLLAQDIVNPVLDNISHLSPSQYFSGLIPLIVSLIIVVGIIVFLVFLLMGGVAWITSGGDKMKLEQARKRLTTALVGLIILLSFIAILRLFETFFGIGFKSITVAPYHIGLEPLPTIPPATPGPTSPPATPTPTVPPEPTPVPPGGTCASSSECETPAFCGVNTDGDDFYGEVVSGIGICIIGLVDCNDSYGNVYPTQDEYFEDPIPGTTNDYNYDCADSDGDGDPNDKWPPLNCEAPPTWDPTCQLTPIPEPPTGYVYGVPECGESVISPFLKCMAYSMNSCNSSNLVPAVSYIGCINRCVEGNSCGILNEPCLTWDIKRSYPLGTSHDHMPCK